ncbi:hypothetical protein PROFUN_10873 [Planoprotostelium fungivorum]|uniref:Uncharacterized protein n=1 Tax=Planoprotostelium fungivorum TaxID=1890364 RepID=A0A2P6NC30_9EUKA|nr:hypothetical protein PROFUN_10873 [Planoprotostelium fungivorum]
METDARHSRVRNENSKKPRAGQNECPTSKGFKSSNPGSSRGALSVLLETTPNNGFCRPVGRRLFAVTQQQREEGRKWMEAIMREIEENDQLWKSRYLIQEGKGGGRKECFAEQ